MFKSALAAVLGERSELGFKPRNKVLVVFIDGLGNQNLKAATGHAPFLAGEASKGQILQAAFPSTTSVNITTFATGVKPGEHGVIGHVVRDSYFGKSINLLNGWTEETDPAQWQPTETISERALRSGVVTNVISSSEYRDTGFTAATMRAVRFHAADDLEERFEIALKLLSTNERSINYLYVQELDQLGHVKGWESGEWRTLLEKINMLVEKLSRQLPKEAGLVITSDHGMIDTTDSKRIELADLLDSVGVEFVGGDTRSMYVYLKDESSAAEALEGLEGSPFFSAHGIQQLIEAGIYGEIGERAHARLPDIVLLAKGANTLYHERFSKPRSYRMIAHHGGLTPQELQIPLIRINV
ncbi:MAG: hypothetical protein RIS08_683 [Actinomycetota bacterium]